MTITPEALAAALRTAGHWVSLGDLYTDEAGAAAALCTSRRTLRRWRIERRGPPWFELSRVVYELSDLVSYTLSTREDPTAEIRWSITANRGQRRTT
jgi:hypothetical protein